MQRTHHEFSAAPMLGFTVAGCSEFTAVVDLGNGTELLDEGCHGEVVGAFTTAIETDPPGQPLEMASGAETGRRDKP